MPPCTKLAATVRYCASAPWRSAQELTTAALLCLLDDAKILEHSVLTGAMA